jgi:hypothetical protein
LAYIIKARRLLTTKYNFTKIIWQFKTFWNAKAIPLIITTATNNCLESMRKKAVWAKHMVAMQHHTTDNRTTKLISHITDLSLGSIPESLEYEGYATNPNPNFATLSSYMVRSLLICRHIAHQTEFW